MTRPIRRGRPPCELTESFTGPLDLPSRANAQLEHGIAESGAPGGCSASNGLSAAAP